MSADPLIRSKEATEPSATLNVALEIFLLDAEARKLTPKSIHFYRQQLTPFVGFLHEQRVTTPEGIKAAHIRSYLVGLQRRGLADASQHAAARAIRAFANFMVREELAPSSPMRNVQMPKVEKVILPAFSPQDVRALLKACTCERDTALVLCLLDTGCRASEFVALYVGDVDLKTGVVKVRYGKGRKQRLVFIGARARKSLIRYLARRGSARPDDPLWVSLIDGERLTDSGLRQICEKLGALANVQNCHPHTFRRTFALWSLRSGMNIYALQQIMRHTDLTMLQRYLALAAEDLRAAHQQYGAIDSIL